MDANSGQAQEGNDNSALPELDKTILLEEYKQVAEDIRSGWQYIFNFSKHFILVQIILISIVGLGHNITKFNSQTQIPSGSQAVPGANDDGGNGGQNGGAGNQASDMQQSVSKAENRYRIFHTALALFGLIFSFGGVLHNGRLFEISVAFVRRAEALSLAFMSVPEKKGELLCSDGESTLSHYSYMYDRIKTDKESKPLKRVENILNIAYYATAFLWGSYLLIVWSKLLPAM